MYNIVPNEWVVNYGCTHHMEKYATLFMRLNKAKESRIYVADDFSLDVVGQGDVYFWHGKIFDIYDEPNISVNFSLVS